MSLLLQIQYIDSVGSHTTLVSPSGLICTCRREDVNCPSTPSPVASLELPVRIPRFRDRLRVPRAQHDGPWMYQLPIWPFGRSSVNRPKGLDRGCICKGYPSLADASAILTLLLHRLGYLVTRCLTFYGMSSAGACSPTPSHIKRCTPSRSTNVCRHGGFVPTCSHPRRVSEVVCARAQVKLEAHALLFARVGSLCSRLYADVRVLALDRAYNITVRVPLPVA